MISATSVGGGIYTSLPSATSVGEESTSLPSATSVGEGFTPHYHQLLVLVRNPPHYHQLLVLVRDTSHYHLLFVPSKTIHASVKGVNNGYKDDLFVDEFYTIFAKCQMLWDNLK